MITQGKLPKAIELLSRILEMYPNDSESRIRRCEALLLAGRSEEARKDLRILKRFPNYDLARLEMLMELAEEIQDSRSNFQARNSITKGVKELSS